VSVAAAPSVVTERVRLLARGAGPAAVAALVLFLAALVVHGDDVGAITRGPLGAVSNVLALASLLLVLCGLVAMVHRHAPLRDGAGSGAALLAGAGTVLVAGGAWAQLVLLPVLAVEAPRVANEGAGLLTAAYVGSFLVAGAGWLLVAVRLGSEVRRGRRVLLIVGAVLFLAPLPARWFLLAVAVSLLVDEGAVAESRGAPGSRDAVLAG
jgi:hypothetical protein